MKTTSTGSPTVKKVTSTQPKKRGRPVGNKKAISEEGAILVPGSYKKFEQMVKRAVKEEVTEQERFKAPEELPDSEATVGQIKDWGRYNYDWQEGFDKGTVAGYESAQSDMKLANKITLVLTAVNVTILISLVIKNVWKTS